MNVRLTYGRLVKYHEASTALANEAEEKGVLNNALGYRNIAKTMKEMIDFMGNANCAPHAVEFEFLSSDIHAIEKHIHKDDV